MKAIPGSWSRNRIPVPSSRSSASGDHRLVAVGAAGEVLVSADNGFTFTQPTSSGSAHSARLPRTGDTLPLGGLKGIVSHCRA